MTDLDGAQTLICVGPSLSHRDGMTHLRFPAVLAPPVARGDLERLPSRICTVAIVDGVFHTQRAVTVREILALLRRGTRVIGSSSMGALRAIELRHRGMEGIGEVFGMYLSGEIESDAEVALLFDAETLTALTEPLVNVRYALRHALCDHIVDAAAADVLLAAARSIHYTQLTRNRWLQQAQALVDPAMLQALSAYVQENSARLDVKRRDAIELVEALNRDYDGARGGMSE